MSTGHGSAAKCPRNVRHSLQSRQAPGGVSSQARRIVTAVKLIRPISAEHRHKLDPGEPSAKKSEEDPNGGSSPQ